MNFNDFFVPGLFDGQGKIERNLCPGKKKWKSKRITRCAMLRFFHFLQHIDIQNIIQLLKFIKYREQEVFHEKTLAARCNQQIFHGKMDKGYEKDRFESLSIKAPVAKKFKRYCKGISKSQSMTLLLMLEFFEHNGIAPTETLGPKMQTLEGLIKKRINGVIAILKDIEKTQTKPTAGMLMALMEAADPKNKNWNKKKKDYEEDDTHPDFYK